MERNENVKKKNVQIKEKTGYGFIIGNGSFRFPGCAVRGGAGES